MKDMKVSGKKESFMAKVLKLYLMELFLMVSGLKVDQMGKECASILMELNIQEAG